jgi:hypothetical protein
MQAQNLRRIGKMKEKFLILTVVLIALVGCQAQSAMAPSPEAIVGTWSWDTASTYFQFNQDGTYRYHLYLDKLEQQPGDIGQYQVEGTTLTFISGDETRVCKPGDRGSYEIAITQEGKLQFVLQEDECSVRRAPSRDPQSFTQVSP